MLWPQVLLASCGIALVVNAGDVCMLGHWYRHTGTSFVRANLSCFLVDYVVVVLQLVVVTQFC